MWNWGANFLKNNIGKPMETAVGTVIRWTIYAGAAVGVYWGVSAYRNSPADEAAKHAAARPGPAKVTGPAIDGMIKDATREDCIDALATITKLAPIAADGNKPEASKAALNAIHTLAPFAKKTAQASGFEDLAINLMEFAGDGGATPNKDRLDRLKGLLDDNNFKGTIAQYVAAKKNLSTDYIKLFEDNGNFKVGLEKKAMFYAADKIAINGNTMSPAQLNAASEAMRLAAAGNLSDANAKKLAVNLSAATTTTAPMNVNLTSPGASPVAPPVPKNLQEAQTILAQAIREYDDGFNRYKDARAYEKSLRDSDNPQLKARAGRDAETLARTYLGADGKHGPLDKLADALSSVVQTDVGLGNKVAAQLSRKTTDIISQAHEKLNMHVNMQAKGTQGDDVRAAAREVMEIINESVAVRNGKGARPQSPFPEGDGRRDDRGEPRYDGRRDGRGGYDDRGPSGYDRRGEPRYDGPRGRRGDRSEGEGPAPDGQPAEKAAAAGVSPAVQTADAGGKTDSKRPDFDMV